jgi:alpha-galactosidase
MNKIFIALLFLSFNGVAQTKQIIIETKNTAIVLSITDKGRVSQSYLGKKLQPEEYKLMGGGREVYLTAGMENQFEPAVRMVHNDFNPSLELVYSTHLTRKKDFGTTTDLALKDPVYPVTITLHYNAYYNEDVVETWTDIVHKEKKAVQLSEYASSLLHFNADSYWLTQFHGDWAREMQMVEEKLNTGIKSIESKLGTRTNFYQTQAFFLSLGKPSTETEGETMAATLAWTGNYKYLFEVDQRNGLRLRSGINSFASEYTLQPGEVFITPKFHYTEIHFYLFG